MKRIATGALCLLLSVGLYLLVQAGNLEPPGPPAPTMKTLDEVEPRIPIRAVDLPLTISVPGSYYLAEDVDVSGLPVHDGISVAASNVSIDLMGFTISNGDGTGIWAGVEFTNITVRNGTVSGWNSTGIHLVGDNHQVLSVVSKDNGLAGIIIGEGVVRDCIATGNGFRDFPTIRSGIFVGGSGSVIGCRSSGNGENVIHVSIDSIIIDCVCENNAAHGIQVDHSNVVRGCLSRGNGDDGIRGRASNLIVDNEVHGNNVGIHTTDTAASGNRIDSNNVTLNATGIAVDDSGNLVIRNSVASDFSDVSFVIVAGNDVGPIGSAATTSSPWANIDF